MVNLITAKAITHGLSEVFTKDFAIQLQKKGQLDMKTTSICHLTVSTQAPIIVLSFLMTFTRKLNVEKNVMIPRKRQLSNKEDGDSVSKCVLLSVCNKVMSSKPLLALATAANAASKLQLVIMAEGLCLSA